MIASPPNVPSTVHNPENMTALPSRDTVLAIISRQRSAGVFMVAISRRSGAATARCGRAKPSLDTIAETGDGLQLQSLWMIPTAAVSCNPYA